MTKVEEIRMNQPGLGAFGGFAISGFIIFFGDVWTVVTSQGFI